MVDPKKLMERLPKLATDKPFRYLGRRVVQAMAEAATTNLVLGQRTAPGRYLVVRLVETTAERESWEQQYSESRAAVLKEMQRESETRDIKLRSAPELDLIVLTEADAAQGEAERLLSTMMEPDEARSTAARLREERELVLPRRVRTLVLESDPEGAQAYVDSRPVGVTPCRVEDIAEGPHTLTFSQRGYLLYEESYVVERGRPGQKLVHRVTLSPEPDMGVLEVQTFPPRARVTIGGETRETPARWRLPAGPVEIRLDMDDFESQTVQVNLPPTPEERPHRVQFRLRYTGPGRNEVVGRLIVYKPGTFRPRQEPAPAANRISSFFRDAEGADASEWALPDASAAGPAGPPVVLGEKPLRRGVFLIGREDPRSDLVPDIKLFDPENSVSRGCHAWLYVYADRSTGAAYDTVLIGNNSPAGIRVDGSLVMESRRLSDESEVEVGNFLLRVVKDSRDAHVEFGAD